MPHRAIIDSTEVRAWAGPATGAAPVASSCATSAAAVVRLALLQLVSLASQHIELDMNAAGLSVGQLERMLSGAAQLPGLQRS